MNKNSKIRKVIKNSFNLKLTLFQLVNTYKDIRNVVSDIKNCEIPEILSNGIFIFKMGSYNKPVTV